MVKRKILVLMLGALCWGANTTDLSASWLTYAKAGAALAVPVVSSFLCKRKIDSVKNSKAMYFVAKKKDDGRLEAKTDDNGRCIRDRSRYSAFENFCLESSENRLDIASVLFGIGVFGFSAGAYVLWQYV